MTTTRNQIHKIEATVWMRWGADARRDIVVPIIFVKGNRRWYVRMADTGETLGWLIREQPQRGTWDIWVAIAATKPEGERKYEVRGRHIGTEYKTRSDAVQELVGWLAIDCPHINPFHHISEAAYEEAGS